MKKYLLFALCVFLFISCKKGGHMYKCTYITKYSNNHPGDLSGTYTTNFFYREDKDSLAALNWYKKTDAYKDIILRSDSIWINYWGTYDEWLENGRQ